MIWFYCSLDLRPFTFTSTFTTAFGNVPVITTLVLRPTLPLINTHSHAHTRAHTHTRARTHTHVINYWREAERWKKRLSIAVGCRSETASETCIDCSMVMESACDCICSHTRRICRIGRSRRGHSTSLFPSCCYRCRHRRCELAVPCRFLVWGYGDVW